MLLLGCIAFALFFLGDYNDWKIENPALRVCFPLGTVLLAFTTVCECLFSGKNGVPHHIRWISGAFALLFLGLLIYTLFFAFSAKDAYVAQENGRAVCKTGVYSICRHPGVLWFIGLYFCLIPSCGMPALSFVIYSVLNILLVVFEDKFVFPAKLSGYDEYKKETPFLIPRLKK